MAVVVESYGTKQKKTCFGCGSMISFENQDIQKSEDGKTFVTCPVCGKHIKAYIIDRNAEKPKRPVSELGRKAKEAFDKAQEDEWDEVLEDEELEESEEGEEDE